MGPWRSAPNGRVKCVRGVLPTGECGEEVFILEVFDSLPEARVLIEDWRVEYNTYRPHRSLRMLTPAEFAARWKQENEARLS